MSEVTAPRAGEEPAQRLPLGSLAVIAVAVGGAALLRPWAGPLLDQATLQAWSTVFLALCIQAMPFLVLGVTVSATIGALVPPGVLARWLPRHPAAAVPVAALAGACLPGCECGSVPIAGRLVARGTPPAAALTFLLAAPAINPVVLVATAVAFPGQPMMVVARFGASFLAACVVGMTWVWRGRDEWVAAARRSGPDDHDRLRAFLQTARHDFLHAGGFLVVGAAAAATLQTVVPRSVLDHVGGRGVLGVLVLGGLAVLLAICSEADAFVAASFTQFSPTAQLAFMVVGPMVDVKLVALQAGTFGRPFASRFAPLVFAVAVGSALLVGTILL